MSRKKDNEFLAQRVSAALQSAYELGLAHAAANAAQARAEAATDSLMEVLIIPSKKDMN